MKTKIKKSKKATSSKKAAVQAKKAARLAKRQLKKTRKAFKKERRLVLRSLKKVSTLESRLAKHVFKVEGFAKLAGNFDALSKGIQELLKDAKKMKVAKPKKSKKTKKTDEE
jgi:hypothetical protein